MDLAVFGDLVVDRTYRLADRLATGGKALGRFVAMASGGTTANVAATAARLGLSVGLFGRVSAGWEQDLHLESLGAAGVDTRGLVPVAAARGAEAVIAVDPDGEKSLIYVPIDADPLPRDVVDAALAATRFAYVMAVDFDRIDRPQSTDVAAIAADLDAAAGLAPETAARVLRRAGIVFVNDPGFRRLTGRAPDPESMARLIGDHAEVLCCTGGPGTTHLAVRESGQVRVISRPALPAAVVDATGAGDAFNAAFLAEWIAGRGPDRALAFALAAGALATETSGARHPTLNRDAIVARLRDAHG